MARTYGPLAAAIWTDALRLPNVDDLFDSISIEVGDHLEISAQAASSRMEKAWETRETTSRSRFPTVVTAESLAEYYSDATDDLLVTAYWHSLRPDRYASTALLHST